jgi:hypothetical protein
VGLENVVDVDRRGEVKGVVVEGIDRMGQLGKEEPALKATVAARTSQRRARGGPGRLPRMGPCAHSCTVPLVAKALERRIAA